MIRLDKLLSNEGQGSRKEVKEKIKYGKVKVNDIVIVNSDFKVNELVDNVKIGNIEINYKEFCYIMLNKPKGVISATDDPKNRHTTVIDLLENKYKNKGLFPVGRLDKDTEGLLILTNNGKFAYNTLSPKKHVSKKYYAEINGIVTKEDVEIFEKGVTIGSGYLCKPAKLNIISADNISKVEITIIEGKFHQIKEMFIAVEKEVLYLKRLVFGAISLDNNLEKGEYRHLSEEEEKIINELYLKIL